MRKRLLVVVLLCMLSLPLSALAGKTLNGTFCSQVDNLTCFPDPAGDQPVTISSRKQTEARAEPKEDPVTSGAFVLASLILLLLRTRTL